MISRLTGKLIEKQPPQIVIDVNGVAYEANVSMQTFYNLPPLNETVQLYTQLVVREDAHLLFGFGTAAERATFRQLVKVSGIGAKTALGILSAMTAERTGAGRGAGRRQTPLCRPRHRQKNRRTHDFGAARQTRTRKRSDGLTAPAQQDGGEDIVQTLLALGYSEREARAAAKGIPPDTEVGEGVRLALKT